MTHTYSDIMRLDGERTPSTWIAKGCHIATEVQKIAFAWNDVNAALDGNVAYAKYPRTREAIANAQYIAAMPDAVGLLKEFKAENDKLKQLLDRAMQGLEEVSQKADEVYGIGKDNTRFCGDIAKQTLADIRKQLGDTND